MINSDAGTSINHYFCAKKLMADISNAKIFVLHYKQGTIFNLDPIYQQLMAGNVFVPENKSIQGDDSGENISAKNHYFSELTGTYWIWKNTSQDVTGTCHYRRFYTAQPEPFFYKLKRLLYFPVGLSKKRYGIIYTENSKLFVPRILNTQELSKLLEKYDAILPQARKLKYTVEKHYQRYHNNHDLKLLESILNEKYPEYISAFNTFLKGKRIYANNMFILKNKEYQEFMAWLFDMLFEFEKRIDLNNYTDYQKRIFGFMAERLLNIWFLKKQLHCIELQVIYFKKFKFE